MNSNRMKYIRELISTKHPSVTIPVLELFREALKECLDEIELWEKAAGMKFPEVSCSNCGKAFWFGDHGFSHCDQHLGRYSHD